MNRERLSSDSSSWSLVDVDDEFDSDVFIENNLVVESVYDSDSDESDISNDEVDVAEEALQNDEQPGDFENSVNEPSDTECDVINQEIPVNEEDDYDSEDNDNERESDSDIEGQENAGNKEISSDDNSNVNSDGETEENDSDIEKVEEEEVMSETAALHYVEPTKVLRKFDELSDCSESSFTRLIKHVLLKDTTRSTVFLFVVLTTFLGTMISHYIGSCLNNNSVLNEDSYCLDSERTLFESSGLQYQEIFNKVPKDKSDELSSCKEELVDAKAEVKMKQGVNRFVREMYKKQLAQAKQDYENRLTLYKRASRRRFGLQQSAQTSPINNKLKTEKSSQLCSLVEKNVYDISRSIYNWTKTQPKSIFSTVSNWTKNQPVVKNFINFTPKFDESLKKVSKWLKNTKTFNNLPKLPNLTSKVFDSVPKKVKNFFNSDITNVKAAITTAIAKTNFSLMVAEYKNTPLIKNIKNNIKSALVKISEFSMSKFAKNVCFAKKDCSSAVKFIEVLKNDIDFITKIGKNQLGEYEKLLKSLSNKNCSQQMECEKDWWLGCGVQFLENCEMQSWQKNDLFYGPALINRKTNLKQLFMELKWISAKDNKLPIKCQKLINAPLPCVAEETRPSFASKKLIPCQPGPNPAKPCQSLPSKPKPCQAKGKKFVKPTGNGRPNWFIQRATTRANQRNFDKPSNVLKSNWFIRRGKARANQRNLNKPSAIPSTGVFGKKSPKINKVEKPYGSEMDDLIEMVELATAFQRKVTVPVESSFVNKRRNN